MGQEVDIAQSEWDRWLLASEPSAGKVIQGPMLGILQKYLWFALSWHDVDNNLRYQFWGGVGQPHGGPHLRTTF